MALNTKIEWTKRTANLWHGCVKVNEGCNNCYAATWSRRWGQDIWGADNPRKMIASFWIDLDKFQRLAAKDNAVHPVFVGSMMDIFENPKPLIDNNGKILETTTDDLRERFFQNITDGKYPNLDFLLLTKRPSNINKYIPESWKTSPPTNVMFGTSVVNQSTANNLITHLLKVKGRRFLSVEPQLARLTLLPWLRPKLIDWVIVGGESGQGKRPFNTDWARQLRDECKFTKTPYFFKQVDKVRPIPHDLQVREFYDNTSPANKVSKQS